MQKGLQKEIVNFEIKFRISNFDFRIYYERRNYDTTLHAS
jgi:hypothetical protein